MKFLIFISVFCVYSSSCSKSVYTLQPAIDKSSKIALPTMKEKKFQNGIDFIASGTIPNPWTLEMDFDNQFVFKTGTDSLSLLAVPAASTSTEKTYLLRDRAGKMDIIISNANCEGNTQLQKTSVKYKDITYTNCGQFLYDNRLNAVWEIVAIGNESLTADYDGQLPTISFNPELRTFRGLSPCLSFSTTIKAEGRHILVSNATATSSSKCGKKNVLILFTEKILGKWMSYKVQGDELYLYLIDDGSIRLRKKIK